MTKALAKHLTVANVLCVVAVFIALGAAAYAAGLARNSVKSKQIKDGAVATQDLGDAAVTDAKLADGSVTGAKVADGSITGAKIADDSITGTKVADDSITGADVNESSLREVPITNAERVGGLLVKEIDYQRPIVNGDVRSVVDFPGIFRIDAQCASVGDGLDITAFTADNNSKISVVGIFAGSGTEEDAFRNIASRSDRDFDSSEAFSIDGNLPSTAGRQHATIQFATPSGFVATIQLATEELGGSCKITGNAIGG
jgi:hypothetical protein